jgi:hypothetical protein
MSWRKHYRGLDKTQKLVYNVPKLCMVCLVMMKNSSTLALILSDLLLVLIIGREP